MTRRCIQFGIQGQLVRGTYHVCPDRVGERGSVGVLLLNTGPTPRAGDGNVGARACDALAALGYPAFRIDWPGIGDSEGARPNHELELFGFVERGGYTETVLEALERVSGLCGVSKFVVGGICAGSVASIFAAARNAERIAGLLLLEPEFLLTVTGAKRGSTV